MYPGTLLEVGFSEVTDSLPKNLCLPLSAILYHALKKTQAPAHRCSYNRETAY